MENFKLVVRRGPFIWNYKEARLQGRTEDGKPKIHYASLRADVVALFMGEWVGVSPSLLPETLASLWEGPIVKNSDRQDQWTDRQLAQIKEVACTLEMSLKINTTNHFSNLWALKEQKEGQLLLLEFAPVRVNRFDLQPAGSFFVYSKEGKAAHRLVKAGKGKASAIVKCFASNSMLLDGKPISTEEVEQMVTRQITAIEAASYLVGESNKNAETCPAPSCALDLVDAALAGAQSVSSQERGEPLEQTSTTAESIG